MFALQGKRRSASCQGNHMWKIGNCEGVCYYRKEGRKNYVGVRIREKGEIPMVSRKNLHVEDERFILESTRGEGREQKLRKISIEGGISFMGA